MGVSETRSAPGPGSARVLRRQGQQPHGILRVDLLQHRIGQSDAINPPAALRRYRSGAVLEVIVLRFEEAEVERVQLVAYAIGAEQDPVLVLVEEPTRGARLAPQLG